MVPAQEQPPRIATPTNRPNDARAAEPINPPPSRIHPRRGIPPFITAAELFEAGRAERERLRLERELWDHAEHSLAFGPVLCRYLRGEDP